MSEDESSAFTAWCSFMRRRSEMGAGHPTTKLARDGFFAQMRQLSPTADERLTQLILGSDELREYHSKHPDSNEYGPVGPRAYVYQMPESDSPDTTDAN
jgi:hypothetical protein